MTKEKLQERIKLLEANREQLKLALIQNEGSLQDCLFWLKELNDQDKPQ